MNKNQKIFLAIFLCSFSSLAYEITLTRIFSIALWYHFAFMIISIAMLGIGASGTIMSLYPRLKDISKIGIYCLLLGVSIIISYLFSNQIPFEPVKLAWSRTQFLYIGIYYITLSVPFFFAGLIITTAFALMSERSGLYYGADLLGAGTGAIGVILLMTIIRPDKTIFILSILALFAAFITGKKRLKLISFAIILLILFFSFQDLEFSKIRISEYKGLQVALRYPGAEHIKTYYSPFSMIDILRSPLVRFAPGLSLRYLDILPEQIGISIDGGELNAVTKNENSELMRFLEYMPSALAYEIVNHKIFSFKTHKEFINKTGSGNFSNVLILDPKGGLQCLVAQYYGFSNIYKIESNPLLIKIMKKDLNEFSGNIYSENTWSGHGRTWLRHSKKAFDIIDIPLTGAIPSGTFGISEDYKLTLEAFREYFDHLKPQGIISINMFIIPPPRTELRLLTTAIKVMKEEGVQDKDIKKHFVAIRSWGSICLLIKKSSFEVREINIIKQFSRGRRFDLIYYPGIQEQETNIYIRMRENKYFDVFNKLLNPETRRRFIDEYIFDVSPVSDENPFFNYYLKFKNIKKIYSIMGRKWQYFIEEGYILPLVFIQVFILSLILIVLPAYKTRIEARVKERDYIDLRKGHALLPYFAFLGTGFMFVEVSIIQKMILPLENASYAVSTVLTSILISSGIGSLFSYRNMLLRGSYIPFILSLLIIIYSLLMPLITDIVSPYPLVLKIFIVSFILMPLGFFMGIPFPSGLKILGEKNELLIPWAWAINGCLSVLSPVLTIMLAMVIGFKSVLILGALLYGLAFINMRSFLKKYSERKS